MECEVCGRRIIGVRRSVIIDGARLVVCSGCTRYTKQAPQAYTAQSPIAKKVLSAPKNRRQVVTRGNRVTVREDLEVVKQYNVLIRKAREKLRLTHDELSKKVGVKVSVLQKLESGKMVPDLVIARKLEYELKIKLLQPISRIPVVGEFMKPLSKLTLGDIVFKHDEKISDCEEEPKRGQ